MNQTNDFAILAPVPEMHLVSGQEVCDRETKVAFGSMAFELFRKADELRRNEPVEVFIYASYAETDRPLRSEASWHGLYIGHVPSRSGRHPNGSRFRPPTTANDRPTWAIFWEVEQLEPLSSPISIASFKGLGKRSKYTSLFIPEGPLLVEHL